MGGSDDAVAVGVGVGVIGVEVIGTGNGLEATAELPSVCGFHFGG